MVVRCGAVWWCEMGRDVVWCEQAQTARAQYVSISLPILVVRLILKCVSPPSCPGERHNACIATRLAPDVQRDEVGGVGLGLDLLLRQV